MPVSVRQPIGLLAFLLFSVLVAGCASRGRTSTAADSAPRVRLCGETTFSPRAGTLDCRFTVDRDAYVLIIATDRQRQPHVVYPTSPEGDGLTRAGEVAQVAPMDLGLPEANVAGLPTRRIPSSTVIAVASATPLRLDALKKSNGDWDELAIARLLEAGVGGPALVGSVTTKGQAASKSWTVAHS